MTSMIDTLLRDHTFRAVHLVAILRTLIGYYVIPGQEPAITQKGTGANMSVDVGAFKYVAAGDFGEKTTTTNVVIEAADATKPRIDLIYIASGTISVLKGTAATVKPSIETTWQKYEEPHPADFSAISGLVLAEIEVPAGVTTILDAYIRPIFAIVSIDHTNLGSIGTNAHSVIDSFIASKAAASGLASLSSGSLVVQDPANATVTPTASKIPIADSNGNLAPAWLGKPYVTVGNYDWCDHKTPGSADQTVINAALTAHKSIVLVGNFSITDQILIPSGGHYSIIGMDYEGIKPTIVSAGGSYMIGEGTDYEPKSLAIENVLLNANNRNTHGIVFGYGSYDTRINRCTIKNIAGASTEKFAIKVEGTGTDPVYDLDITNNLIQDCIGVGIWVIGTWPIGDNTASRKTNINIDKNRLIHCKPVGAYAALHADEANITDNLILGCGVKGNLYNGTLPGGGIGAGFDCLVRGNKVVGVATSGINTKQRCVVQGNTVKYCGANGIDFYYSSHCVVNGNICIDNGQSGASGCECDMSGIDVSDATYGCVISGNLCTNLASGIASTLSSQGTQGNYYITVVNPGFFAECEGMRIKIGSTDIYRIDYIDPENGRIYLTTALSTTYANSSNVVGVNMQRNGIQIADTGSLGNNHSISGNLVWGNTFVQVGAGDGGDTMDGVYVAGDGCFYYNWDDRPSFIPSSAPVLFNDAGVGNYIACYIPGYGWYKVAIAS